MRARWSVLVACLGVGAIYVAYPYATLLRLGLAVRSGDAATLETLVDWPSVREGIKEDICDMGGLNASGGSGNSLPAFGASFVRGIATHTIDQALTPQALLASTTPSARNESSPHLAKLRIDWAFFDSPTSFIVMARMPGQTQPIRMEMDLQDAQWRVNRVWLPDDMLSHSGSRT